MLRLLLILPFLVSACEKDETVSGFVDPDSTYHLVEIDGASFDARATIQFPQPGVVSGNGPCNSYGGDQSAPYPWLEFGALRVSRRECADGSKERHFFASLTSMTQVEALGDTLILRNEGGGEMVFSATQP